MSGQPPGVAGESAGGTPVSGNELVRRRHEKLRALRAAGVDPFGTRFPVSHWAGPLHARWDTAPEDELRGAGPVSIAGRVMSIRHHGKSCFAHVLDQTGTIQLYARADVLGEGYAGFTDLDVADFIGVTGDLMRTRTGELTVQVKAWTFLSKSVRPLPEKWHGLKDVETRYRQRYVDLLVNPGVRDAFQARARIIQAIRAFLDARGFLEVETPVMQPLAGGALARPFATHHNALDIPLFLRIALELHLKRLVVGGFDRVYEIGRIFRNEGVSTQHNPEFTMLEFYQAYADYNDLIELTEAMFAEIGRMVTGGLALVLPGRDDRPDAALAAARLSRRGGRSGGASAPRHPRPGRAPRGGPRRRRAREPRRRRLELERGHTDLPDVEGRVRDVRRADARPADLRRGLPDRAVAAGAPEARRPEPGRSVRAVRCPDGDGERLLRAERPRRAAPPLRGSS